MKLKWQLDKNKDGRIIERVANKNGIYIENEELFENNIDDYENEQLETETYENENGDTKHRLIIHRQVPSAEQIDRRRKQLVIKKLREEYDINDEIALVKDAINALQVGKEISVDYTNMELAREAAKRDADDEIDADLFKIAKKHEEQVK